MSVFPSVTIMNMGRPVPPAHFLIVPVDLEVRILNDFSASLAMILPIWAKAVLEYVGMA